MKIFITGATGFLGTHTVQAALDSGHEVLALTRRPRSGALWSHDRVRMVRGDLLAADRIAEDILEADAVIHLAATKLGDLHEQLLGTVVATEALLRQLPTAGGPRLVHVSTFSVYDYDAIPTGSTLDESSPTEIDGDRDGYTETKLLQERLVRDYAEAGGEVVIVRPGLVWGANELWDGGHAVSLGRYALAIGPRGGLKLTYIENCAEALVLAAESPRAVGSTINIVDDDQPSQADFAAALRAAGVELPKSIPVPYAAAMGVAHLADFVKERLLHGRARTPTILDPERLAASRRHHAYSNKAAKDLLGWSPRYGFAEAVQRAVERQAID